MNATQFCGALNDNLFKMFVQMFLIGLLPEWKDTMLSVATVVFAVPFLLFTAHAGYLADRFSKSRVVVALKYLEALVMGLGLAAFLLSPAQPRYLAPVLLFSLFFLMAFQSALFSPTKYGIVPELVPPERLGAANSSLMICTYLAIILGTAAAPLLAKMTCHIWPNNDNRAYFAAQWVCMLIAAAGIVASHAIPRLRPADPGRKPDWLFARQLWRTLRWASQDYYLSRGLGGTFLFTLIATFLQIALVSYGMDHLGLEEQAASFQFFWAAVGIAAGAWVSGRLSHRNTEMGLIPTGAFLMAINVTVIGLLPKGTPVFAVAPLVFQVGLGCGLFVVPLDTFLQFRLPPERRGEGLALNTFVSWLGVLGAGVLMGIFSGLGIPSNVRLLLMGALCGLLAAFSTHTLRDFFARFLATLFVRCLYHVRVIGQDRVPIEGPAILVANHSCYFDSLLLGATTRRRIRFLMAPEILLRYPFLRFFARLYRVIPISATSSPFEIARGLREARRALDEGYLVALFPEGRLTRDGELQTFQAGFTRFAGNVPVLPVGIRGAWRTMYYYDGSERLRHRWRRILFRRFHVTVAFGPPLSRPPTAEAAHDAVASLLVQDPPEEPAK